MTRSPIELFWTANDIHDCVDDDHDFEFEVDYDNYDFKYEVNDGEKY